MGAAGVGRLCRKGSDALMDGRYLSLALPRSELELAAGRSPRNQHRRPPENFVLAVNLVPAVERSFRARRQGGVPAGGGNR